MNGNNEEDEVVQHTPQSSQNSETTVISQRKWLLLGGLSVLIVVIGVWGLFALQNKTKISDVDTVSDTTSASNEFFIAKFLSIADITDSYTSNWNATFINPKDGGVTEEQKISAELPLVVSGVKNRSVQFTTSGDYIAYATEPFDGMGGPEYPPHVGQFFAFHYGKRGTPAKEILVDASVPYTNIIADWKLTGDGKEIYYIKAPVDRKDPVTGSPETKDRVLSLYVIDMDTNTSRLVAQLEQYGQHESYDTFRYSKLYELDKDNSIRWYAVEPDGIYETRYDRQKKTIVTKKVVNETRPDVSIRSLSPDGTKLLYWHQFQNEDGGYYFSEYPLADLESGEVATLPNNPGQLGSYDGDAYWSPDSTHIVTSFNSQLYTTNVKTREIQIIMGKYEITPLGWSPDGNYIAYSYKPNATSLNLHIDVYDLKNKKSINLAKDVSIDSFNLAGWVNE